MAGNDSNAVSLLHFDGTNGSTTFTDSAVGGAGHAWTAHGSAQLSTSSPKFGTAAGLFAAATSDYIDTPDSTDFAFGSGDFTIDCQIKTSDSGSQMYICGQASSAATNSSQSFQLVRLSGNTIKGSVFSGTTETSITSTSTFTDGAWHHIAFARTGNTLKLFVDGTQEGSDTAFSSSINDSTQPLAVGRNGAFNSSYWNGSIDEFRISNVARWTANFTAPTVPYGASTAKTISSSNAQAASSSFSKGRTDHAQSSSQLSITRQIGKGISSSTGNAASIKRVILKTITSALASATSLIRGIRKLVTAQSASSIALVRSSTKILRSAHATAGTIGRAIARRTSAISTNTALVVRSSGHAIFISLASSASAAHALAKALTATTANVVSTARGIRKNITASHSQSAGVISIRSLVTKIVSSIGVEVIKLLNLSALKAWPPTIPSAALAGTYTEKIEQNAVTFTPEIGPPKIRSATSAPTEMIGFDVLMSSAQYELLKTFFRTTLKNGTKPFSMTHPRTATTTTFIFMAAPKIAFFSIDSYRVTLALRRKP